MENQPEVIRQQMEETRASLTDKLEVLEQQVLNTVQDAGQTVESVKDTVGAVKDVVADTATVVKETVQETVAGVKETVRDTVATVKETFSIPRQVDRHPWAMFLGATFVGYLGERLLERATTSRPVPTQEPPSRLSGGRVKHHGNGKAHHEAAPAKPSLWDKVAETYGDEIAKLKALAISAAGGMARQLVAESAPPAYVDSITEIVDNVTAKLAGTAAPEFNVPVKSAPAWERKAAG